LTTEHRIFVDSQPITLELKDVTLSAPSPLIVRNTTVTIISTGANHLTAFAPTSPAIACASHSTLTFYTHSNGSLSAYGGSLSPGIGAAILCHAINIHNGTYSTSGIGSGYGPSNLHWLNIYNGDFTISSTLGAGIGAGFAEIGNSTVGPAVISNGTFRITAANAAGIGAGHASGPFLSTVESFAIQNGRFAINASNGAAVGSGYSYVGRAAVDRLEISGGRFAVQSVYAAAIGAGSSAHGDSSLPFVNIRNATITAGTNYGAAIGAGFSRFGAAGIGGLSIAGDVQVGERTLGYAAGIGGGYTNAGDSSVGNLTIVA
jgi:hypothetical protein